MCIRASPAAIVRHRHRGADRRPGARAAHGLLILAIGRPFTLEGNLLMLDNGMGLNSAFLHLSRISVRVGDGG
ncbi:hypothetical protein [Sphingomonas sp.]|uniref:hypothetical protein n=1 Tax=Sphingomonas sp. TaxID=28214 RepID=UPI0035BC5D53